MWGNWHKRLKAHKEAMENPPADADLAAALELDRRVRKKVKRAAVNHWFHGKREPEISQFFVLCELLKADPVQILGLTGHAASEAPKGIIKHDMRSVGKGRRSVMRNPYNLRRKTVTK